MYTVASPDPNPRGGGQLPNPKECNSTLTSGTNNIYPYPYIDVNDRGHRCRSGSPLTIYPHASSLSCRTAGSSPHSPYLDQFGREGDGSGENIIPSRTTHDSKTGRIFTRY